VTLKGPVRSDEEKKTIEDKAAAVAGAANVKNELTIVAADSVKTPK
jgi:osmotically-inducible protein OsmY